MLECNHCFHYTNINVVKEEEREIYSFADYSQCFMLELIKLYISLRRNGGNKEFHINYISINLHISLSFHPPSLSKLFFSSNISLSLSFFQAQYFAPFRSQYSLARVYSCLQNGDVLLILSCRN